MVVVEATVKAVLIAEDVVNHDPIHERRGKKVATQMGHQKNVVFGASNLGILPGNVGPRRRWARPT
jgi:hypothetical protein